MSEPFRILVVCVGNVCRSPLAERHLRHQLDTVLGPVADSVEVTSAGVRALAGHAMDTVSAQQLERLGGSADGFVARQLTRSMMREADLVLTATRALRSRALEDEPLALRRTFTLREFAALARALPQAGSPSTFVADAAAHRWAASLDDYDVLDPAGRSLSVHQEAADLIGSAVGDITAAWSRMLLPAV